MIQACAICGRRLTTQPHRGWRNWACDACADAYELRRPVSQWPAWARALVYEDGQLRESERERARAGIEFVPLPDDDCD